MASGCGNASAEAMQFIAAGHDDSRFSAETSNDGRMRFVGGLCYAIYTFWTKFTGKK